MKTTNLYSTFGYTITYDPISDEAYSPELNELLKKGHHIALKGKDEGLKQLKKMIEHHPNKPQFKNYLSVWYQTRGNSKKANEVNQQILQKHPNYLFAKINLANNYLSKEEPQKVLELFGENIDLKAIYPERDTFHFSEVISILDVAVRYFIIVNDLEQAELRLQLLRDIAPDGQQVQYLESILSLQRIKNSPFLNRTPTHIVDTEAQPKTNQTEPPILHHVEVYRLYDSAILTQEDIDLLLSLPRATLIKDLEAVLHDSIARYSFFEENITDYTYTNFVLYSVFLLQELRAEDSLSTLLTCLKQSEEYIDLFFSDFLTMYIWQAIFILGENKLDELLNFMQQPYVYTFSKSTIGDALAQLALYHPEKRQKIVDWFTAVFQYYLQTNESKGIIDETAIGSLICAVLDFEGVELYEDIHTLFNVGYVDETVCGDWQSVSSDLGSLGVDEKRKLTATYKLFQLLVPGDEGDIFFHAGKEESIFFPDIKPIPSYQGEKEPHRNDPCTCGSGKKYKKCCWGN